MLFLLFQLGGDRYALDAVQIAEVLPLLSLTAIPDAPPGVAGLMNYHGAPVPVIDLSALALGRPSRSRMSTRMILVHYPDATGTSRLLGLVAERATETMRREPADFVASGVNSDGAPYLGPVVTDDRGVVQRVTVSALLSDAVRDALFRQPVPAP
jgi:chemotaxis-related protein WspB